MDVPHPRLAWVNIADSGERGQEQSAWQVRVASTPEQLDLPDLWDSGKTISENSNRIEYQGQTLYSRQECWWQVRVWDRDDKVSAWSEPGFWRMGILNPSEWQAVWIGAPWQGEEALPKPGGGPNAGLQAFPPPAPMLRKSFLTDKTVKKAVAFVTGLGYFELYLNGAKLGDDVLVPNQTNYGKRPNLPNNYIPLPDNFRDYRVMYLAYDVSDRLIRGENVIGSMVGNGFYNPAKHWTESYGSPRFLCQLHIIYKDGTEQVVISDETWKADKSPVLMDMVYYGEHYDARLEQPGWNTPGFDDSAWQNVAVRRAPEGRLVAHTAEPDRVMKEIAPVRIEKFYDGLVRIDFGTEISGWLRLNDVTAPAGHKIEIRYLANRYSGDNSYIFRGDGPETYSARFNWFVFHSVEISNWPGELEPEDVTALAVNTSD